MVDSFQEESDRSLENAKCKIEQWR
jgi:hypothetical protein